MVIVDFDLSMRWVDNMGGSVRQLPICELAFGLVWVLGLLDVYRPAWLAGCR